MSFFAISPVGDHVRLSPPERTGSFTFSVQNKSGTARELRAIVVTNDGSQVEWYRVREPVQFARLDETLQFIVDIQAPPDVEAGSYAFQLKVVAADDPDDTFSESQRVSVEAPPPEPPTPLPWWVWVLAAAVVLGIVAAVLFFVTRNGDDEGVQPPVGNPLPGTSWELHTLNTQPPVANTTVTARFTEDEIFGSGGCNGYGGTYEAEGSDLVIRDLARTLIACLEDAVNQQESDFMGALAGARSFSITDGDLIIDGDGGTIRMRLSTPTIPIPALPSPAFQLRD